MPRKPRKNPLDKHVAPPTPLQLAISEYQKMARTVKKCYEEMDRLMVAELVPHMEVGVPVVAPTGFKAIRAVLVDNFQNSNKAWRAKCFERFSLVVN